MNISIIIPNYNGGKLLQKNIPKIVDALEFYEKESGNKSELVIIDDHSTDNSVLVINNLKKKYQGNNLKTFINRINSGFSTTVNKGVELATGDLVVLLNTDVSPDIDFLAKIPAHFKDKTLFAVGFLDKSIEDGKTVLRGRGIGKWYKGFLVHEKGDINFIYTLWAGGGSSAYSKQKWNALGGLYDIYNPFYWEDIDLSYRAWKAGLKIIFDKRIIVTHEHEQGTIRTFYSQLAVKTIAYRNQFMFVWINASDSDLLIKHFIYLPFILLRSLLLGDFQLIYGFKMAIMQVFKVLKLRVRTQRLAKVSDKNVIKRLIE